MSQQLTLLSLGLVLAASAAAAPPRPPSSVRAEDARSEETDLSGQWRLNPDLSEDARAKMREAMGRRGPGGSGPGSGRGPRAPIGGGRGPGAPGGGGGPFGRSPAGGGPDSPFRELMEPPEVLAISQEDDELVIDRGEGRVLRIRPDGRKVKREGGEVEVKARWSGPELVVETETERGTRLVSTYLRVKDRRQLHVTTRVDGPMGEVTVRRVYDAAEEEAIR